MNSAENYKQLLQEISKEAVLAKRDPSDVKLLVVSKTHPWREVEEVYNAGCRAFGENRVQEAMLKKEQAPGDIDWHLIGTLQKNKVSKVIGQFGLIHSVDDMELAEKISEASGQQKVVTPILFQVNTSGEESKHGFTPLSVSQNFHLLNKLPSIKIEGLMTMAPLTEDKAKCIECFLQLKELRDKLGLKELSMGMSNDWREAIHAGSTILRIGSAVFGD